ncbi:uncharacterized protein [Parasteatoda tepidariorum]|uniref:uncharacterized protein n=1 Tax=Parasteatoda tepidariorum TaxID=114398 RepID=UPI001C7209C9|nr:BTB/POZ domain-containing protein At5g48510-like [Parasteatoda tepidariorum]
MSSVFKKISRLLDTSRNLIEIEMKIEKSDIEHTSILSKKFFVTATEAYVLEYCILARDDTLALLLHGKKQNMLLGFSIFVADGDGVYRHSRAGTAQILKRSVNESDLLVGFVDRNSSLKYPLSITCHLEFPYAEKSKNQEVELQCLRKLSVDFKKILDQATETDVTLKVDGVNIKANKVVLRARSPVFNKMFEHDTSERDNSVINIEDIRAPIMEELVSFLYSGTKEDHDFEEACDLYYAADKYEVLSLRDACRSDLLDQLQVGNACQMLILANRHGDVSFKEEIMKFINMNFKSVINTESFGEFVKSDADIALSLMRLHVNTH